MRNRNKSMTTRCIQQFATAVRFLRSGFYSATKAPTATSVAWMGSVRGSRYVPIYSADRLIVCTRAKLKTVLSKEETAYYLDWGNSTSSSCPVFFGDLCPESQSYSSLAPIFRHRQRGLSTSKTAAKGNTYRVPLDVQIALTLNNFAYQQSQGN